MACIELEHNSCVVMDRVNSHKEAQHVRSESDTPVSRYVTGYFSLGSTLLLQRSRLKHVIDASTQNLHSLCLVLVLRALVLTLHRHSRWNVGQPHLE